MEENFNLRKINRSLLFWLIGLLFAFLLVFLPTWQSLWNAWSSSDDYSHGFLIVPLCLYIVWLKRSELLASEAKPSWLFFPLILLALFAYLLSRYGEILSLAPLAMIFFIAACILFLFGPKIFLLCAFPLFLLLFMVPVPTQIYASLTIPLQLLVTKTTVFIAGYLGIPILREGNVIYLPEHTLQVVDACSGLRSIMALLMLGAVIAYFGLQSQILRGVLFVSAVPIAILVNIVRVLTMVVAFYYFNFDLTTGSLHTMFGTFIFVLAIGLFLLFRKGLVLCQR